MIAGEVLTQLASWTSVAHSPAVALNGLADAALHLTASRNAFFAVLDHEEGTLSLKYGSGPGWASVPKAAVEQIGEGEGEGIVSAVVVSGEPIRSGNVLADPRYRELFPDSASELAIPILDRHQRVSAVLNLESDRPDHYTSEHEAIAQGIALLAAVILDREERRRREEALVQIGSALDRSESEKDLIEKVLAVADEVLEFHSFSLFLFDRDQDLFVLRASAGNLRNRVGEVGYHAHEGLTGWVCAEGKPLLIHHPQQDPRWLGRFLDFPSEQIASYLAVPILYRGRSIGALRVIRRLSQNPLHDSRFNADDERLLTAIADQLAIGLENLRSLERALRVERMAAWGEMSAKSSHMIGNRVFALKGDVNELGFLVGEDAIDREALLSIQRSLETNVSRIDELLQEFREYLTAAQVSPVRADLNFLVREAVQEVFPRRSKIKLVFDLQEDLPEVLVDAKKFRRAVTELVENALGYFEEGELRIRTRLAEARLLERARLRVRGPYIAIEVEDQGPGVPDHAKEQIFQPFFSSRTKGMGLGLSIVRGILEAHGGTVLEVGSPGEGAKFTMLLPCPERP